VTITEQVPIIENSLVHAKNAIVDIIHKQKVLAHALQSSGIELRVEVLICCLFIAQNSEFVVFDLGIIHFNLE
jgi:hypothetical protein